MKTKVLLLTGHGALLAALIIGAQPMARGAGNLIVQGAISGNDQPGSAAESDVNANNSELDYSGQPARAAGEAPVPVDPRIAVAVRKASQYYRQGQFSHAIETLKPALAIAPDSIDLLNSEAAILAESGSAAAARHLYEKIAAAQPGTFTPAYNLAELLLMEHRFVEARIAFQNLLVFFPNSDLLRFKIILIDILERKRADAGRAMLELKGRGPSPSAYYAAAAEAFDNGDIQEEQSWISEAERDFGAGRQQIFYQSLADFGFVDHGAYPPQQ